MTTAWETIPLQEFLDGLSPGGAAAGADPSDRFAGPKRRDNNGGEKPEAFGESTESVQWGARQAAGRVERDHRRGVRHSWFEAVRNGEGAGLFLSMPSQSYEADGETKYTQIFHPITARGREYLEKAVHLAYHMALEGQKQEERLGMELQP